MENLTYDKIEVPGTHKEVQSKLPCLEPYKNSGFTRENILNNKISTHFDIRVSTVRHLNTPNVHSLDLILTLG